MKKKYTKRDLKQMVIDSLNEIGPPEHDHPENGGRVSWRMVNRYGEWLLRTDPEAFYYAAQDMGIDLHNGTITP